MHFKVALFFRFLYFYILAISIFCINISAFVSHIILYIQFNSIIIFIKNSILHSFNACMLSGLCKTLQSD